MISLSYLPVGQKAKISGFSTNEKIGLRFMEMGLKINETIQILGKLPFGGNLIILSKTWKIQPSQLFCQPNQSGSNELINCILNKVSFLKNYTYLV